MNAPIRPNAQVDAMRAVCQHVALIIPRLIQLNPVIEERDSNEQEVYNAPYIII